MIESDFIKLNAVRKEHLPTVFDLLQHMSQCGIQVASHYVPLHSSEMGLRSGKMDFDIYTTIESERLVRLPLWFGMQEADVAKVIKSVVAYFN